MEHPAAPSPRTSLKRHPERGVFDAEGLNAILDEALIAFVGFETEDGPTVLPLAFARMGDALYVHGAENGRLMRALCDGRVCVSVALTDGIVIARSAFRCSMNYRSVVAFGRGRAVTDATEKRAALDAMVHKLSFGAGEVLRSPSDAELRATGVVAIPLTEASAKIRTGPPRDAAADVGRGTWAGEVTLAQKATGLRRAPDADAADRPTPAMRDKLRGDGVVVEEREHAPYLLSTDASRVDLHLVHGYLSEQAYWARGRSRACVARSIAGSIVAGAYLGGAQVGFARAVSDAATFAWIADVLVLPEHRGRGIARGMLELLLSLEELRSIRRVLLGTKDAHPLYAGLGFSPLREPERFMEILRA